MAVSEYSWDSLEFYEDEAACGEEESPYRGCRWARSAAETDHVKACLILCEILQDYYFGQAGSWKEVAFWYCRLRLLGNPHDPRVLWFTGDNLLGSMKQSLAEPNSVEVQAKQGSLVQQRWFGQHLTTVLPPDFESALAWLTLGHSHAFKGPPRFEYGEDTSVRARRLLDLILDKDERSRSDAILEALKSKYPPKPPRDINRAAHSGFWIFEKDRSFDIALNAAMAAYSFGKLSSNQRAAVRLKAQDVWVRGQKPSRLVSELTGQQQTFERPDLSAFRKDIQIGLCVNAMRELSIGPLLQG